MYIKVPVDNNFLYITVGNEALTLQTEALEVVSSVPLTNMEQVILSEIMKFNLEHAGLPISAKRLEERYVEVTGKGLSLHSVKNTISSLRTKISAILSAFSSKSRTFDVIKNVNRRGYFISFELCSVINARNQIDISFQHLCKGVPFRWRLFYSIYSYVKFNCCNIFKRLSFAFLVALVVLVFAHAIQIYLIKSNILSANIDDEFSAVLDECMDKSMELHHESYHTKIRGLEYVLNFIFTNKDGLTCKSNFYPDELSEFSKSGEYFDITSNNNPVFKVNVANGVVWVEMSSLKFSSKYEGLIFSFLVAGVDVKINKQPKGSEVLFFAGETGENFIIYQFPVKNYKNITVSIYAQSIPKQIILTTLAVYLMLFICNVVRVVFYFSVTLRADLTAEPIFFVPTSRIEYYEILSRFKNKLSTFEVVGRIQRYNLEPSYLFWQVLALNHAGKQYYDLPIALNVQPELFRFGDNIKTLKLLRFQHVVIEITEGHTGFDDNILHSLNELKREGFKISIDDFGTGSNNLEVLNQLALDYIKIDKLFIMELINSSKNMEFLELLIETINVGCGKSVTIIAEGVEDSVISKKLVKLGVLYQQGFLFKRTL